MTHDPLTPLRTSLGLASISKLYVKKFISTQKNEYIKCLFLYVSYMKIVNKKLKFTHFSYLSS